MATPNICGQRKCRRNITGKQPIRFTIHPIFLKIQDFSSVRMLIQVITYSLWCFSQASILRNLDCGFLGYDFVECHSVSEEPVFSSSGWRVEIGGPSRKVGKCLWYCMVPYVSKQHEYSGPRTSQILYTQFWSHNCPGTCYSSGVAECSGRSSGELLDSGRRKFGD